MSANGYLSPKDFSSTFENLHIPEWKPYSFSDVIRERLSKEVTIKTPMKNLYSNLDDIYSFVKKQNQDWCFMVCGPVGSGKSTLALHIAYRLDPKFDMKTQMIYDMKDWARFNSEDMYGNTPYKVMLFDEAVSNLFNRKSSFGDNNDLIEWLTKVRASNYFIIFVIPSPWTIDLKVRDERAKTMFLTSKNLHKDSHWYSYYGSEQFAMINGKSLDIAKKLIQTPNKFVKRFHPKFEEQFPRLDYIIETEYLKYKKADYRGYTNKMIDKYLKDKK